MTTQPISVRDATEDDQARLVAWQIAMALETENKGLDADIVRAGVAAVLAQPQRGRYLIAQREGARLGGLLITYEWSDWRAGDFFWIQSVYVESIHRGQGVYRALHGAVCNLARARGAVGVRLYVEQDNHRAQQTYRARGMLPTHYAIYEQMLEPDV